MVAPCLLAALLALAPAAAAAPGDDPGGDTPGGDTATAPGDEVGAALAPQPSPPAGQVTPTCPAGQTPPQIGPSPAPDSSSPLRGTEYAQALPVPGNAGGLLAPAVGAGDGATAPQQSDACVQDGTFSGKRVVDLDVYSQSMGGTLPIRLLLPEDWYDNPSAEFPVLYLMPGYGEPELRNRVWTHFTDVQEFFADKNALVVLVPGGVTGFFSDWWNYSDGDGPTWETFHVNELPKVLQRSWRANGERAIAGLSMGGFGAMSYAARHPDFYSAAASYSGFVHTTMPGMSRGLQTTIADAGNDPYALWGDPSAQRGIWAAHDPYENAQNLRGMNLYISANMGQRGKYESGDIERLLGTLQADDPAEYTRKGALASVLEQASYVQTQSFESRLDRLNIPVTSHYELEGIHYWPYWEDELHRSWPMLAESIGLPAE